MKRILMVSCLLFIGLYGTSQAQRLEVTGEVLTPLSLELNDIKSMNTTTIKAKDSDDIEHAFSGVPLESILKKAGVTLGEQLRGENLAKFVLVTAADGYEVLFSLAEMDPYFSGNTVLLAVEMDGKPLPNGYGPFRLIVPNDIRHGRWIREIRTINIIFHK